MHFDLNIAPQKKQPNIPEEIFRRLVKSIVNEIIPVDVQGRNPTESFFNNPSIVLKFSGYFSNFGAFYEAYILLRGYAPKILQMCAHGGPQIWMKLYI